jgi:hypothetical protein
MSRFTEIVVEEIREAIPATIFFMIVFHMILITKNVVLEGFQATPIHSAVATVGALIVAKAILIVEKIPVSRLFAGRRLYNIVWKTLLFAAVSLLFHLAEELIPLVGKYHGLPAAATHLLDEVSWPQFFVVQMWLLSSLFLYCLVTELSRVIGAGRVRELLLGPKR